MRHFIKKAWTVDDRFVFMFKQMSFCLCLIGCFITLSVSEDVLIKVQGMLPGNMQFCSMQNEAM